MSYNLNTEEGRKQYSYYKLIDLGYQPHQAAGVVGNLVAESNVRPFGVVGDKNTSQWAYGVAQWRGDRLDNLKAYAASKGKSWDGGGNVEEALSIQLEFYDHESRTSEKRAGDMIRRATNVEEATAGAIAYERPAGFTWDNPSGGLHFGKRLTAARDTHQRFPLTEGDRVQFAATGKQRELLRTAYEQGTLTELAANAKPEDIIAQQRHLEHMRSRIKLDDEALKTAGVDLAKYNAERGVLSTDEVKSKSADDKKKLVKEGDGKFIDPSKANFGEESKKAQQAVGKRYAEMSVDERKTALKEDYSSIAQEQYKAYREARERGDTQTADNVAKQMSGLAGNMDPFDILILLVIAGIFGGEAGVDEMRRLLGLDGGARGQTVSSPVERDNYQRDPTDRTYRKTKPDGIPELKSDVETRPINDKPTFGSGIPQERAVYDPEKYKLPINPNGTRYQQFIIPTDKAGNTTGKGVVLIVDTKDPDGKGGRLLYAAELPYEQSADGTRIVNWGTSNPYERDMRAYWDAQAYILGSANKFDTAPVEDILKHGHAHLKQIAELDPKAPDYQAKLKTIPGYENLPDQMRRLSNDVNAWQPYKKAEGEYDPTKVVGVTKNDNEPYWAALDKQGRLVAGNHPEKQADPMSITKAGALLTMADMHKKGELPADFFRNNHRLIDQMMQRSNNDIANLLAVKAAGSKEAFLEKMNRMRDERGLTGTNFASIEGLNTGGSHYSTALDSARIGHALQQDDTQIVHRFVRMQGRHTGQRFADVNETDGGKTGTGYGNFGRAGANKSFMGVQSQDGTSYAVVEAKTTEIGQYVKAASKAALYTPYQSSAPAPVPGQNITPANAPPIEIAPPASALPDGERSLANASAEYLKARAEAISNLGEDAEHSNAPVLPENVLREAIAKGKKHVVGIAADRVGNGNWYSGRTVLYKINADGTYGVEKEYASWGGGKGSERIVNGTTPLITRPGEQATVLTGRLLPNHTGTNTGIYFGNAIQVMPRDLNREFYANDASFNGRGTDDVLIHKAFGDGSNGCNVMNQGDANDLFGRLSADGDKKPMIVAFGKDAPRRKDIYKEQQAAKAAAPKVPNPEPVAAEDTIPLAQLVALHEDVRKLIAGWDVTRDGNLDKDEIKKGTAANPDAAKSAASKLKENGVEVKTGEDGKPLPDDLAIALKQASEKKQAEKADPKQQPAAAPAR
jgi:hypothetical protein